MSGRRMHRSAFTLLEILVVIAILVVLVTLAAPNVIKFFGKSKVDTAKMAVGRNGPIANTLKIFKLNSGLSQYPTTEQGLKSLITAPDGVDEAKAKDWPMLDTGPESLNDPWGNPYQYACPGTHNTDGFDLWPTGPDGKDQDGTINGICNWDTSSASGGVTKGPS